jgi:hypothetical protein
MSDIPKSQQDENLRRILALADALVELIAAREVNEHTKRFWRGKKSSEAARDIRDHQCAYEKAAQAYADAVVAVAIPREILVCLRALKIIEDRMAGIPAVTPWKAHYIAPEIHARPPLE